LENHYYRKKTVASLPTTDDSQHQPKNFFEDSNEAVIFVDNTCVTVIGKVVGGSVEQLKMLVLRGWSQTLSIRREVI
jgi:hypothetical protein